MSSSSNCLVLVVERDKHVRAYLGEFLQNCGCEIIHLEDGDSALRFVRERRPDLVITEVLLSGLDGLSLCREIKLTPATSEIPVVVLTVLEASGRAALAGADGFVRKPLEESVLVERLRPFLPDPQRGGDAK